MRKFFFLLCLGFASLSLCSCEGNVQKGVVNVTGQVSCQGQPLEGVVVSDGKSCTITDSEGIYLLSSEADFVFVVTPSGYLPECEDTKPIFFQRIDAKSERNYDFTLLPNPQDDNQHTFIFEADVQANTAAHWKQYEAVSKEYAQIKQLYSDRDFFALNCGDLGWDTPDSFYPLYMNVVKDFGFPIYHCVGNHDMNYTNRSHEGSYSSFEKNFGPCNYSFNRGKAHYVVVDNCFYFGRDYFYMGYLDEKTLSWMESDLSYVPKDSPVFLICHIPLRLSDQAQAFDYNSHSIGSQTVNVNAILDIYKNHKLYVLSGHTHSGANMSYSANAIEHNTPAVCGSWWAGELCLDGAPQGYGLYHIDGTEVKWIYKGFNKPFDYQSRLYPIGTYPDYPEDIVANVWNYDSNYKVEWTEDGVVMGEMIRFTGIDRDVEIMCIDNADVLPDWVAPEPTGHLFRAKPHNPKAKMGLKVTDCFGEVFLIEIK